MKIVINKCYGGFELSNKAYEYLIKLGMTTSDDDDKADIVSFQFCGKKSYFFGVHIRRDNPLLVQVVEELGEEANGECSSLKIVEIPNDLKWEIDEYDGMEHISEIHRTWG